MIEGKIIGDITITVCESPEGTNFFHLQADNQDVLPVLNTIEDTLNKYWANLC